MIKELLFGRTPVPLLGKGLDALYQRQKAVATNIANANSAGYTRRVVDFEAQLRSALKKGPEHLVRTDPRHLSGIHQLESVRPVERQADDQIDGPGSQQVIAEREMADLAEAQLKYEAEVRMARYHFDMLKMAIRGTG